MTPLNQIHWENLKVGNNVIGPNGQPGTITHLYEDHKHERNGQPLNNYVDITWKDGNTTDTPHHTLDTVLYIGS